MKYSIKFESGLTLSCTSFPKAQKEAREYNNKGKFCKVVCTHKGK